MSVYDPPGRRARGRKACRCTPRERCAGQPELSGARGRGRQGGLPAARRVRHRVGRGVDLGVTVELHVSAVPERSAPTPW